jgi:hypothetical protein
MIRADAFYSAFDTAFASAAGDAGFRRQGRQGSKWKIRAAGDDLHFNFRVNPKASAIPGAPGEFWPVIVWDGKRYNSRDDGTVSYYQYLTAAELETVQAMRRAVVENAAAQDPLQLGRDHLRIFFSSVELPLTPQNPHVGLYYFDAADAAMWGKWFGEHIGDWLRRFGAEPETLERWARRVLWSGVE